ncbi:MAG: hypothetical protein R6U98_23470, partial [Pirellulaceae bacterium]
GDFSKDDDQKERTIPDVPVDERAQLDGTVIEDNKNKENVEEFDYVKWLDETPLNPPDNKVSEYELLLEKMRKEQGDIQKE